MQAWLIDHRIIHHLLADRASKIAHHTTHKIAANHIMQYQGHRFAIKIYPLIRPMVDYLRL